ncbi:MAG: Gfo/Idh/MocA family oxidoreductase [Clostridia bacterium]|nr:Gfo/Idh/MocA family oxidoreductase [Clostridia bacterium]
MKKVNVAILGTGVIANKLAKAFSITENANLYAVASRDKGNACVFAEKHGIAKAYGSYKDAIGDPFVDLIYIALPHPLHYTWAKEALLCGKNVLCEKPLCVNSRQAEELFTIAKEKGLFFSEAMWTRFLPVVKTVKKLIDDGEVGNIKKINALIAHDSTKVYRMTDPSLAGGILLDCGVYLITSVFLLMGDEYSHIKTKARLSKKGVDLHSLTCLTYPDQSVAKLFMAMNIRLGNKIKIIGTKGTITMNTVYNWQNVTLKNSKGKQKIAIPQQRAGGFEYMTEGVCNAILQGKKYCDELTPADTLSVMQLMDSLREKWNLKYPCE